MVGDREPKFTPAAEEAMRRLGYGAVKAAAERAYCQPVRVSPSNEELARATGNRRRQERWDHTGVSIVVDARTNSIVYVSFNYIPGPREGQS